MTILQTVLPEDVNQQQGFSLLEVLISLVVLSIGLIGMAGIQQAGVRNNHNALLHSQASMLAYEIADMMRSNVPALESGQYTGDSSPDSSPDCIAANCSVNEMSDFHLNTWFNHLSERLPQGTGAIACLDIDQTDVFSCSAGSVISIDVSWVETDIGGAEEMTFTTEVQL